MEKRPRRTSTYGIRGGGKPSLVSCFMFTKRKEWPLELWKREERRSIILRLARFVSKRPIRIKAIGNDGKVPNINYYLIFSP